MIVASSLVDLAVAASGPSHTQIRKCYSKVFSSLQKYELTAGFVTGSDTEDFVRLFGGDRSAPVFMDLMGCEAFGQSVPLEQYVRFINEHNYMLQYRIRDVQKGTLRQEGHLLVLPLSFTKTVSYFDNNEVYFSPESFLGAPIRLTAEFVYDTRTENCFIRSINGTVGNRASELPAHFTVIRRDRARPVTSQYDSLLLMTNGAPPFDENGQLFYGGDVTSFQTWDPDIRVSMEQLPLKEQGRYNLVRFRYRPVSFRVQMRLGFAPMAYATRSANDLSHSSFAFEPTLHVGYAFQLGRQKLVPTVGFGLSLSGLNLKKKEVEFAGSSGASMRNYSIDRAAVGLSFTDWVIPAGLEWEYRLDDNWLINAHAGMKYYLHGKTQISNPYTIDGTVDGEPLHLEADTYVNSVSLERTPSDFSLTGGAGADYNLLANRLFVRCSLSYERALKPCYSQDSAPWLQADQGIYPLVYDAAAGLDKPYAPLYGSLSFARSAIWLHVGVVAKF